VTQRIKYNHRHSMYPNRSKTLSQRIRGSGTIGSDASLSRPAVQCAGPSGLLTY
jgi:hypothetical protein